jgi:putative membrane protein insertion efficiency factor
VRTLLLFLIRIYQLTFSAIMGKGCRYDPTCSDYATESVRRFGALKGTILGIARICRCHPWHPGGHDPVPDTFTILQEKT